MIRDEILKKEGVKIAKKDFERHYKLTIENKNANCDIERIISASKDKGLNITFDDNYIYIDDFTQEVADLFNNVSFLKKANMYRIKKDCEKCKFLSERLGRGWCDLWDTEIVNVAKIGKGCVPFRFLGMSPDNPMRQTQFQTFKKAVLASGISPKPMDLMKKFLEYYSLDEDGQWIDKNTFLGDWGGGENGILFGIRYNPENNKIQMGINKGGYGDNVEKEYDPTIPGLEQMLKDWRSSWGLNTVYPTDKTADLNGNKLRPERNFDWLNREDYRREINKQKTKRYDTTPSNVGDKYPPITNSFNDADIDVSSTF